MGTKPPARPRCQLSSVFAGLHLVYVWKAGESRMCPSGGGYLDGEFSGTKMRWLDRKNCWLRCNSSTVGVGVRGTAIPPIPFPVFSPLP